jgi:hypothetical protein
VLVLEERPDPIQQYLALSLLPMLLELLLLLGQDLWVLLQQQLAVLPALQVQPLHQLSRLGALQ